METKQDLVPLTAEQQADFDQRRQSDTVIQTKCANCGAWWETARLEIDFQEAFNCDCGTRMSFSVQAAEHRGQILKPTNDQVMLINDGEQRLDTGMKVTEATQRSEIWWNKIGRKEAKLQLKRQKKTVGGADHGAGSAFATMDVDSPNFLPSGLIHGKHWDALTKREKLMIVKSWHHFHVRIPDLIGSEGHATHRMQDRETIQ